MATYARLHDAARKPSRTVAVPAAPPALRAEHPQWVHDLVASTDDARQAVVRHEAWRRMREGTISRRLHRLMLVGFWPLIERFPHYLALNLLKTRHGHDAGVNAARAWLARNLRAEARHAEWYLDWAAGLGVPRDEMLDGERPVEMTAIADWCWQACHAEPLAEAMAATNYAVEGVTGDWVRGVASSGRYRKLLGGADQETAMRWLEAHASYDAAHPLQALDIIVQLVGTDPPPARVAVLRHAVLKSHELYRVALDAAHARSAERT